MSTRTKTSPARTRHIPGEAGPWVLIFGDLAAFTVFYAT